MRKNFGAKPLLYPQPVMIIGTYDENGKANAMNAAWGGIVGMNEIIVDLSSHKTTDNLKKTKAFTVSVADTTHMITVIMWAWFLQTMSRTRWKKRDLQQRKVSLSMHP